VIIVCGVGNHLIAVAAAKLGRLIRISKGALDLETPWSSPELLRSFETAIAGGAVDGEASRSRIFCRPHNFRADSSQPDSIVELDPSRSGFRRARPLRRNRHRLHAASEPDQIGECDADHQSREFICATHGWRIDPCSILLHPAAKLLKAHLYRRWRGSILRPRAVRLSSLAENRDRVISNACEQRRRSVPLKSSSVLPRLRGLTDDCPDYLVRLAKRYSAPDQVFREVVSRAQILPPPRACVWVSKRSIGQNFASKSSAA